VLTHIITHEREQRLPPIAYELIPYAKLNPSYMDPRVHRREVVVKISGIEGPEISTLTPMDISHTYVLPRHDSNCAAVPTGHDDDLRSGGCTINHWV